MSKPQRRNEFILPVEQGKVSQERRYWITKISLSPEGKGQFPCSTKRMKVCTVGKDGVIIVAKNRWVWCGELSWVGLRVDPG